MDLNIFNINILYKEGKTAVSLTDAKRIAAFLRDDPDQAFGIPAACSFRTELMISRMLALGLPASIISRAGIYATQGNPYDSDAIPEKRVMHINSDESPINLWERLGRPERFPAKYSFKENGFIITAHSKDNYSIQNFEGSAGWHIHQNQKGYMFGQNISLPSYHNHHTVALSVQNPETGKIEDMVIDPDVDYPESGLMTYKEWQFRQNCPSALVMNAKIGEYAYPALASDKITKAFKKQYGLDVFENEIINHLKSINLEDYKKIMATVMEDIPDNLKSDSLIEPSSTLFFAGKNFQDQVSHLFNNKCNPLKISYDWDSMTQQDQNKMLALWSQHNAPMAAFQNWLFSNEAAPVAQLKTAPALHTLTA